MTGISGSGSDVPTVGATFSPGHATWSTAPSESLSADGTPKLEALTPGALVQDTYRIQQPLGAGAMGAVYLALHEKLGRKVALKLHLSASPSARARTLREAQAMARLSHPHVVTVYDVGDTHGGVFIAMEYLSAGTARDWLTRSHDWREVVDFHLDMARGLAAAHQAGLVHRDFKPENVLVGADGRPKVADFGIARAANEDMAFTPGNMTAAQLEATMPAAQGSDVMSATLTQTGAFMGTPAYMAPEQFAGSHVDARADQFAFCVALWEALYGVRPFPGRTPIEIFVAMKDRRFAALPTTTPVPASLKAVLLRGLAVDPSGRYADMNALIEALEGTIHRRGIRRSLIVGGSVVGGLGLLAVGGVAAILATGEGSIEIVPAPPEPPAVPNRALGPETADVPAEPSDAPPTVPEPPVPSNGASAPPPEPPTVGFRTPDYWDGKSEFKCHHAYPKVELRGRSIVMPDDGDRAAWIAGDCEVRIIDCDISGNVGLDIGGATKVYVENSTFRVKNQAASVGGEAEVKIVNSRVVGSTLEPTFYVAGEAKLELVGMDLRSTIPVKVSGLGTLRVDGGSLTGAVASLQAWSSHSVKLRGVELSGKIEQWPDHPAEILPAGAPWGD